MTQLQRIDETELQCRDESYPLLIQSQHLILITHSLSALLSLCHKQEEIEHVYVYYLSILIRPLYIAQVPEICSSLSAGATLIPRCVKC